MSNQPYWIATADTQLGAIHWTNPEREEDYYEIFQNLCTQAAQDPKCLGLIGMGDLRERASIQSKNLKGLNTGLRILLDAGKDFLATMGNHDYTTPNWIEAMCYPSLHNFTDPAVQTRFGFDPETTLVLDFHIRSELEDALARRDPAGIKLVILHQSLKEMTTSMKQSYDISLQTMADMGFGSTQDCLVMLGDLHNYGDCSIGKLQAVYPGSPEMTDINEGVNGLRSERIQSNPHDYRKFALRYFPADNTWEPFELKPRPWFRGKAKTPAETDRILDLLKEHSDKWEKPGCLTLTVPKKDIERARDFIASIDTLEARVEEFSKESEEDEVWENPESEATLSWAENKKSLVALAEESGLQVDSLQLLREIVGHDGSTPNPKNDVASAWDAWVALGISLPSKDSENEATGSDSEPDDQKEEESPSELELDLTSDPQNTES